MESLHAFWLIKSGRMTGNSRHPAADGYALLRVAMSATSTMVRFVLFVCHINCGALCPLRLLHHLRCALSSSSVISTMVRFVLFVCYINYGALCPLRPLHQLWCALSSSSVWSFTLHSFGIGPRCTYFRNSALFLVLSDSGAAIHTNIVQI
jgi:hypothetical protein